jgi:Flp pilus assembly protein CpaB
LAIGRIAKYPITAGNLLSAHDLALHQANTFEAKLKPGYRAVTLPVDSNSGVAGFVAPGSHVDIFATTGGGGQTHTGCILSDVEVVAAGTTTRRSESGETYQASTVTVSLTPLDTAELIKAESASGKLCLALRSDKDHAPVAAIDVTHLFQKAPASDEVAFLPRKNVPIAPDSRQVILKSLPPVANEHQVEIIFGSKRETLGVPKI